MIIINIQVWGGKAESEKFQIKAAAGGDTLDIHHEHGGDGHNTWGYYDHDGPEKWPRSCQDGIRQSPIDIRASSVDYAIMNELQFVDYDKADRVTVYNTGHGGMVVFLAFLTSDNSCQFDTRILNLPCMPFCNYCDNTTFNF